MCKTAQKANLFADKAPNIIHHKVDPCKTLSEQRYGTVKRVYVLEMISQTFKKI